MACCEEMPPHDGFSYHLDFWYYLSEARRFQSNEFPATLKAFRSKQDIESSLTACSSCCLSSFNDPSQRRNPVWQTGVISSQAGYNHLEHFNQTLPRLYSSFTIRV